VIAIGDHAVIVGGLPGRALRLVAEWADLHRDELAADWERVLGGSPRSRSTLSPKITP
jgi:Domain of unknown function (DUF4160)